MNEFMGNKVRILIDERTGESKFVSIQNVYLKKNYTIANLLQELEDSKKKNDDLGKSLSYLGKKYNNFVVAYTKQRTSYDAQIKELENKIKDIGGK